MEDDLTWLVLETKGRWPNGDNYMAKGKFDGLGLVLPIAGGVERFTQYRWFTKAEYMASKAELQNKPSWEEAPEQAVFMAQEPHGMWTFFAGQPFNPSKFHNDGWRFDGFQAWPSHKRGEVIGDWRDTLERRPVDMSAPVVAEQVEGATWFERGELPPVGIWCEASCDGAEPEKCKVIAYHKQQVAVQWSQFNHGCLDVLEMPGWAFRPIRPDRDKAIEEMIGSVLAVMNHGLQRRLCEDLYDAGYRKQEGV
ncbi:hypothetical protein [Aeromonas hydrophila]|uniref:hypothetical protein n=1 Tax=Aeromonas hydrophila TaxID=644 RepID=UPI002B45BFB7|nr:hypothetical protein [Aeromonas hydrophila]